MSAPLANIEDDFKQGEEHIPLKPLPNILVDNHVHKAHKLPRRIIFIQLMYSIIANLSILSSGMGIGFPAISLGTLEDTNHAAHLTKNEASWFASLNMLMSPIGALLCSYFLDRIGRKYTLICINIISIISWGIMGFSNRENSETMFYQLLASRIIIGIVSGLSSAPAAVYAAEIAHPTLRGRLILLTSFAIATGILIVYCLGVFFPDDFRLSSLIACGICIVSLLLVFFIPESPNWLVLQNKRITARQSLIKLKGIKIKNDATSRELDKEIELILEHNKTRLNMSRPVQQKTLFQILQKEEVYKPLLIMIGFFAIQQFSGIFVVIVYAVQFTKETGIIFDPFLCAVFIGTTRILATTFVSFILDRWGRRPPTIVSGLGTALCMFGLAIMKWLHLDGNIWSAILIIVYVFASTIGFLTIPFAMIAEIYPQRYRGLCSGLTVFAAYVMSFVMIKLYPTVLDVWDITVVYMFFGVTSLLGIIYVWIVLPETKGKSLKEIEDSFKTKKNKKMKESTPA